MQDGGVRGECHPRPSRDLGATTGVGIYFTSAKIIAHRHAVANKRNVINKNSLGCIQISFLIWLIITIIVVDLVTLRL